MPRSTYYYQERAIKAPDPYADLKDAILRIYNEHHRRYGYRRITAQLNNEGVIVNHKTVHKLMTQLGLRGVHPNRHYHSFRGKVGEVAPNVIDRNFVAARPLEKCTTDVTQICIHDVKSYLSPVLDMFNGEILGYTISRSPDLKMVTSMLRKVFHRGETYDGLIMHSDQGWHYQHPQYQKMLKDIGIVQSMSRKGNCLDNAIMESFFGTMKNELLYLQEWDSIEQFEKALRTYIVYYNEKRIMNRLNGMSPVQYRAQYDNINNNPSNF